MINYRLFSKYNVRDDGQIINRFGREVSRKNHLRLVDDEGNKKWVTRRLLLEFRLGKNPQDADSEESIAEQRKRVTEEVLLLKYTGAPLSVIARDLNISLSLASKIYHGKA